MNKNGISKRISPPECGTQNDTDRRMEEISSRLRRSFETASRERTKSSGDGKSISIQERRDLESLASLEYAKEKNLWIPDIYDLGNPFLSGSENTVVLNSEEVVVYKSNNLMNSKTISGLLDQITIHNQLFPETKYELVGFTGIDKGEGKVPYIEVVLKQSFINIAVSANSFEIANYMKSLEFKMISNTSFANSQYTISDLYPRNVLKDNNGDLYIIDNIVSENKQVIKCV